MGPRDANGHDNVREQYDEVASLFEEGRARMALYLRHCQDPVIFRTLGGLRGKSLLDLACGDGFYTRRFRKECGAEPVVGVDLSPMLIRQAEAAERREPLGIDYQVGDVTTLARPPLRRRDGDPPAALPAERSGDRDSAATVHSLLHYVSNPQSKLLRLTRE